MQNYHNQPIGGIEHHIAYTIQDLENAPFDELHQIALQQGLQFIPVTRAELILALIKNQPNHNINQGNTNQGSNINQNIASYGSRSIHGQNNPALSGRPEFYPEDFGLEPRQRFDGQPDGRVYSPTRGGRGEHKVTPFLYRDDAERAAQERGGRVVEARHGAGIHYYVEGEWGGLMPWESRPIHYPHYTESAYDQGNRSNQGQNQGQNQGHSNYQTSAYRGNQSSHGNFGNQGMRGY